MNGKNGLLLVLWMVAAILLFATQTYASVPVNDAVYHILEQAELRGLYAPLPLVKPYSRFFDGLFRLFRNY